MKPITRPHLILFKTTIKDNIDELENLKKRSGQVTTSTSSDPDWVKDQKMLKSHAIESHLAQATAHLAELIQIFPTERFLNAVQLLNAVNGIVQQLKLAPFTEFASLQMDDSEKSANIVKASDKLIDKTSYLLRAVLAEAGESLLETKKNIENVAHEVSNALEDALDYILDTPQNHNLNRYNLVNLASKVAEETSKLINNERIITETSNNMHRANAPDKQLVVAAHKSARAATQLVAVARLTAPSIYDLTCQQQLADAMEEVSIAIEGMHFENKLRDATEKVFEALAALNGSIHRVGNKGKI